MFDALRKMIFPIIIIVLVFFGAMIVLQWGLGMSSRRDYDTANLAGTINGEEIPWAEYSRSYSNMLRAESEKVEDELPDDKILEIQETAWNQIVADRLMMQQVEEYKIVVTDDELYTYLKTQPPAEMQQAPYFQTDGRFDYSKYVNAMAEPQFANYWASIEPFVKRDILKLKMQEIIYQKAFVTEAEVKEYFVENSEQATVEMINVDFARFSKPPPRPEDEEIRAYFDAHQDDYAVEERVALNVAMIEKEPSPFDWEQSYTRCKELYDSVIAGAEFARIAREYSEDNSAEAGGDLGWFESGRMVDEFNDLAFGMNEGDISEPVRTQFGWHVLQHHGYKEEMGTPRGKAEPEMIRKAHVSHILIKTYASQNTLDEAHQHMQDFYDAIEELGFVKAAKENNVGIRNSGLFVRGAAIKGLGRNPEVTEFAFSGEIDDFMPPQENNSAFYAVQIADRQPAGPAAFEDVKVQARQNLISDLVSGFCRDTAAAIKAEIDAGVAFAAAAQKHDEDVETPTAFTRSSYVKGIGRAPQAIGAAFSLTQPGQISAPIEYDQGCVIFKLVQRSAPDLTEYTAAKDSLQAVILNSKRQEMFGRWFQTLRDNSEIENFTQQRSSREMM